MNGWICLHRKILNWEWYDEDGTFRLFLHLLLTANHKDKKWKGFIVKRGQLITGLQALSEATGLSIQRLRTAFRNLMITGEVTREVTNRFSLITICNYEDYQDKDDNGNRPANNQTTSEQQPANNQPTISQQSANNQIYPNNNVNNINKGNNENKTTKGKKDKYDPHEDKPDWITTEQLESLILHRKQHPKKPVMTKLAFTGIFNQLYAAGEMGYSIDECLEQMSNSSWISFKAEYMENKTNTGNSRPKTFSKIKEENNIKGLQEFIDE